MIGRNSIVKTIKVPNLTGGKVKVQLNKNGGVCDIILPIYIVEPIAPQDASNDEAVNAYNQAKQEYRALVAKKKAMRSTILNAVQGRPYIYAVDAIKNLVSKILNDEKGTQTI